MQMSIKNSIGFCFYNKQELYHRWVTTIHKSSPNHIWPYITKNDRKTKHIRCFLSGEIDHTHLSKNGTTLGQKWAKLSHPQILFFSYSCYLIYRGHFIPSHLSNIAQTPHVLWSVSLSVIRLKLLIDHLPVTIPPPDVNPETLGCG